MKQLKERRYIYYFMSEYNGIRIRSSYVVSPTEVQTISGFIRKLLVVE